MSLPLLSNPNLWTTANDPRRVYRDGDVLFMVLPITARMLVIYRTEEELFSDTVLAAYRKLPFVCAINGLQYTVSRWGIADALIGNDPVPATETEPDGQVVSRNRVIGGRSSPLTFYVSNDHLGGYHFGQGNPPLRYQYGIGGLGPIIIGGLPHGIGNVCRRPANCPPTGPVPPNMQGMMEQRNNETYAAQQRRPTSTGKTILATNKNTGHLLILVQPDGVRGVSFDDIKTALLTLKCDNAVFLDGSDSAMLNTRGYFDVRQGADKDETNTIGLAFYL